MRYLAPGTLTPSFVETPACSDISKLVATVSNYGDVGAVVGMPGVGKSFVTEHLARSTGREVIYFDLPSNPTQGELLVQFLRALTRKVVKAERYVLSARVEEELSGRDCICIVDNAQGLKDINYDQLSYLHGQPTARWALLIVGGLKVKERLQRYEHLASRVHQVVTVSPLAGESLIAAVRALHPTLAHMPAHLIQAVDLEYGQGRMRRWVRFLRTVSDLQDRTGMRIETVDERIASIALHQIQGGPT